jgi:hypothetical protein
MPSTLKTKTSHSNTDKSKNCDKPTMTTDTTTPTAEEHHSIKPSTLKTKTSHSNTDKSNDGGVIDSEFGHSNPLSDALDAMSNTLDHLFG